VFLQKVIAATDSIGGQYGSVVETGEGFSVVQNYKHGALYHGSSTPVQNFKVGLGKGRFGNGLYLTPSSDTADFYSKGGRQGNAGQKVDKNGTIYQFEVKASVALIVTNGDEFSRWMVSEDEDAEKDWDAIREFDSARVTKHWTRFAKDSYNADVLVYAEEGGVLTPFPQIIILNDRAVKRKAEGRYEHQAVTAKLSAVLYHKTGESAAIKILKEDQFRLSTWLGGESDRPKGKDHLWYLSMSYKPGAYQNNSSGVVFVLNGENLDRHYDGEPFDYWGPSTDLDEAEERIFSNEPMIKPASSYIHEIHADWFMPGNNYNAHAFQRHRELTKLAKQHNIKIYWYDDQKSLDTLPKDQAKKFSDFPTGPAMTQKDLEPPAWGSGSPYAVKRWRALLSIEPAKTLKDIPKDVRKHLSGYSDGHLGYAADIHNASKGMKTDSLRYVYKMQRQMERVGAKDLKTFYGMMMNKLDKLEKASRVQAAAEPKWNEPKVEQILKGTKPLTSPERAELMKAVDYWDYINDTADEKWDADVIENVTKELTRIVERLENGVQKKPGLRLVSQFKQNLVSDSEVVGFSERLQRKYVFDHGRPLITKLLRKYVTATPQDRKDIEDLAAKVMDRLAEKFATEMKLTPKKGVFPADQDYTIKISDVDPTALPGVQVIFMSHHPGADGSYNKTTKTVTVNLETDWIWELWDNFHGLSRVTKEQYANVLHGLRTENTLIHELTHALDDVKSKGRAWSKSSKNLIDKGYDFYLRDNAEVNARYAQALKKIRRTKLIPDYQDKYGGWENYRQEFKWAFSGWEPLTDDQKKRILVRLSKEYKTLTPSERESLLIGELQSSFWDYLYKGNWDTKFDSRLGQVDWKKELRERLHTDDFKEPLDEAKEKGKLKYINKELGIVEAVFHVKPFLLEVLSRRYLTTAGLSSVLYHYTDLTAATRILQDNKFRLSKTSQIEQKKAGSSKLYYLSTSRVPYGSYTRGFGVHFKLDGKKLGERFKGTQVDYWAHHGKINDADESEDRVLADTQFIEPAVKYIKEIHVLPNPQYPGTIRPLWIAAKKLKIPIFFYSDPQAFRTLNKKKTAKPMRRGPSRQESGFSQRSRQKPFTLWLELYHNSGDLTKLSKEARNLVDDMPSRSTDWLLERQVNDSRKSDDPQVQRLFAIWRKHGLKNEQEFLDFLKKKFIPLLDSHDKEVGDVTQAAYRSAKLALKEGKPVSQVLPDLEEFLKTPGNWKPRAKTFFNDWFNTYLTSDDALNKFMAMSQEEQNKVRDENQKNKEELWEKAKRIK